MLPKWRVLALSCTYFTLLSSLPLFATNYTVTLSTDSAVTTGGTSVTSTTGDLRFVLNQILNDQAQGTFATRDVAFTTSSVTLSGILPMVNLFNPDAVTIGNSTGPSVTIDGGGFRP